MSRQRYPRRTRRLEWIRRLGSPRAWSTAGLCAAGCAAVCAIALLAARSLAVPEERTASSGGLPIAVASTRPAAPASHPAPASSPAATPAHAHATASAPPAQPAVAHAGGWGRGGYPMVPGGNGKPANAAAVTSVNWSGYAATGAAGTFTSVSSAWTQPAVTCGAGKTFASFWVGLDGDGTATVEQTGTEADCAGGTATYAGWWEMFPNAPVFYASPVKPGDAMSASVTANGGGSFTLTLRDATQGWSQTTKQASAAAKAGSAEVIAEAPSGAAVLPLANFSMVSFSNAAVNGAPLGDASPAALTMMSAAGVTEATPSALTSGNFSVSWQGSGAPAGQASAQP
jgi:Peptidase A4 family